MASGVLIILIFVLIITLVTIILAVMQLINIRKIVGYNISSKLQIAYDYSIGVLILNLFTLIFIIVALIYFSKAKMKRTSAFTVLIIFSILTVLASIILCGLSAAGATETVTIVNLVVMIINFILIAILLFFLRKIPQSEEKVSLIKDCPKCADCEK